MELSNVVTSNFIGIQRSDRLHICRIPPSLLFFLPLVFFSPGGVVSEHNLHFSSEPEPFLFPRMSEKDILSYIWRSTVYSIARSIDLRGAFSTTPIVLVDKENFHLLKIIKAETGVSTSFYSMQRIKMFLLILVISCSAVYIQHVLQLFSYTLLNVCLIFILVGIRLQHWIHCMTVTASFI